MPPPAQPTPLAAGAGAHAKLTLPYLFPSIIDGQTRTQPISAPSSCLLAETLTEALPRSISSREQSTESCRRQVARSRSPGAGWAVGWAAPDPGACSPSPGARWASRRRGVVGSDPALRAGASAGARGAWEGRRLSHRAPAPRQRSHPAALGQVAAPVGLLLRPDPGDPGVRSRAEPAAGSFGLGLALSRELGARGPGTRGGPDSP